MTLDLHRSQPLVFVDDLERPALDDSDLHHFERVRRLRTDDPITISDGAGHWRLARFAPEPVVDGPIEFVAAPAQPSTVAFAPVKGERPEWVVQKLTELGIDMIVPLTTRRSVVRWDTARAAKQVAKWQSIAREASMQSRRVWLPVISPVTPLAEATATMHRPVFAEPGATPLDPAVDRTILIGPEGGWDPAELEGQAMCALPGGVLRAETAALAAAVLLATGE